MFWGLVALLYYLCFLLLVGLSLFILRRGPYRRMKRTFLWLALCLLAWQLTLFLEVRTALPAAQLWLGRANFSAIAVAVYLALRFVQQVAGRGGASSRWLRAETGLLSALTLLTPFVSAEERVHAGHAVTTFSLLFPLYLLHVLGYLFAALIMAFRARQGAKNAALRAQLTLIGMGMLSTGGVALVTNALLPYGFGDFRFCDIGTLSTLFFVLCVAYAVFVHGLFDLRILLRKTLVYGLLLSFVLGAYSSAVFLVTQFLTESAGKLVQFAVLLIAFSFDPLRRFLEQMADRLLFGGGGEGDKRRSKQSRGEGRTGIRTLALLFPWHRS